jgi:hypothetical protein
MNGGNHIRYTEYAAITSVLVLSAAFALPVDATPMTDFIEFFY